ncbi:hypothetical protein [Mycetocola sp. JXN-3]|uniref:hypothetical protein n=1 Tax=Mycetocola sp. JXN-3 TaxID=2116510 RepID=UPI00165D0490|nr:hypothetical protein [Mycetocola sp. JXN-3]
MTESTPATPDARDNKHVNGDEVSATDIAVTETASGDTAATESRIGDVTRNEVELDDVALDDSDLDETDLDDADLDALATPAEKATPISKVRRWLTIAIAVVFGLLFAYQVWGGVGSAITIPRRVSEAGGSVSALGWTMLVLSIIVPLIALYLSYRIGRRRGWISMILTYLVGVAASSAIALSLAAAFFLA